ncbi:MAG: LuxR C-terminal-related transcriptional regulator [Granulosicoccaceae bacterium]
MIAWLSLDSADSDLPRFLTYLIAAIARVEAGFGEAAKLMLQGQQLPPTEELLVSVLNELASLERELVLVLDDYHLVDSVEVDQALVFLIEHLPPQLHIIVSTREDPQFPLATWRVKGWFTEFRASDLRFNAEESGAFFSQTMGIGVSEPMVCALERRTEGWIAGLQLAALSLRGRQDPQEFVDAFTGSHRFVLDYLAEEVLHQLSESDRNFMLQTAVLDRLNGGLCDAVTCQADAEKRLKAFDQSNLFLVPLDDRRKWFRYHHLFRDVLRSRLHEQLGDGIADIHSRASTWFAENNFPLDAVQHMLEVGDPPRLALLIEQVWPSMRASTAESVLVDWLSHLPESEITKRPVLCAHYGFCLLSSDIERSEFYLREAERWVDQSETTLSSSAISVQNTSAFAELPGMLAIGRAYQAGAKGELDSIISHCERALELLSEDAAVFRGAAAVLLGMVHWSKGDLPLAYAALEKGHQSMRIGGEISGVVSTLYLLAMLRVAQGRLTEATVLCQQGEALLPAQGSVAPQGAADIYVIFAAIKTEQHCLDEADVFLEQARALGTQAQLLESRHLWHVVDSRIATCRADYHKALRSLDEAEQVYIPSPAPSTVSIDAWRARVNLVSGNVQAVEQWLDERAVSDDSELHYMLEFEHLVLARFYLVKFRQSGDMSLLERCEALVLRLKDVANAAGRVSRVVECWVLLALSLREQHERSRALDALGQALALAEMQGYRSVFLEDRQLADLLVELAPSTPYAAQMLGKQGGDSAQSRPAECKSSQLSEPLSERELDVLRCLDSELSGPEIANKLFVSLNTLRTHSKNIYAKLGVNSRRAAVKRAADLGLR